MIWEGISKRKKRIYTVAFCVFIIAMVLFFKLIKDHSSTVYSQIIRGKGNIISNLRMYYKDEQLKDCYYSNTLKRNSRYPLNINTYDGSNQAVHPDIVYNPGGIFNHKYWLAFTPYPYENDKFENPCILVSEDGINFVKPKGAKNPLDNVNRKNNPGGHLSDTDLIYTNNELLLHYVYNTESVEVPSKFYEIKSDNGITWSKPNMVYKTRKNTRGFSPTFVSEKDNTIKLWYYQSEDNLMFTESNDGEKTWKPLIKCKINMGEWKGWYVDIIKTDIGYEGLICARQPQLNQYALFYARSKDGLKWSVPKYPLIFPNEHSWDSRFIYRSTFLKENGIYRVWYSACNQKDQWHIAYTQFTDAEIEKLNKD